MRFKYGFVLLSVGSDLSKRQVGSTEVFELQILSFNIAVGPFGEIQSDSSVFVRPVAAAVVIACRLFGADERLGVKRTGFVEIEFGQG